MLLGLGKTSNDFSVASTSSFVSVKASHNLMTFLSLENEDIFVRMEVGSWTILKFLMQAQDNIFEEE